MGNEESENDNNNNDIDDNKNNVNEENENNNDNNNNNNNKRNKILRNTINISVSSSLCCSKSSEISLIDDINKSLDLRNFSIPRNYNEIRNSFDNNKHKFNDKNINNHIKIEDNFDLSKSCQAFGLWSKNSENNTKN